MSNIEERLREARKEEVRVENLIMSIQNDCDHNLKEAVEADYKLGQVYICLTCDLCWTEWFEKDE